MPNNRPGWGAFLPRYNIPETFGTAISYEAQLHWFLENWNDVADFANALEQPTIELGGSTAPLDNDAVPTVTNTGDDINAVLEFSIPKVYNKYATPPEWTAEREYELLTTVIDENGDQWTSLQHVPEGQPLEAPYWLKTLDVSAATAATSAANQAADEASQAADAASSAAGEASAAAQGINFIVEAVANPVQDYVAYPDYFTDLTHHLNASGELVTVGSSDGYRSTPYIPVRAGQTVSYRLCGGYSGNALLALYDWAKTPLTVIPGEGNNVWTEGTLTVAQDGYLLASHRYAYSTSAVTWLEIGGDLPTKRVVNELYEQYSVTSKTGVSFPDTFVLKGKYIKPANGELGESANFDTTRPIALVSGDVLSYCVGSGTATSAIIAVYDKTGRFVSAPVVGTANNTLASGTWTADQDCYVMVSDRNASLASREKWLYVNGDDTRHTMAYYNPDAIAALTLARHPSHNVTVPQLSLLHFSDIHADSAELARIIEFKADLGADVSDMVCTGDMVANKYDDGMTWFDDVEGSGSVLLCIGNHDVAVQGSYDQSSYTQQETYDRYFAGRIDDWGVTYTSGLTYYYKDYTDSHVRLVILNAMLDNDTTAMGDQVTWLASVLDSARGLGYSVVIGEHYPPRNSADGKIDTNFTDELFTPAARGLATSVQDAVQTFIDAGGDFVCFIAGHVHTDLVMRSSQLVGSDLAYPSQHFIIVANASRSASYSDFPRTPNTRYMDCVNLLTIDTVSKMLKVVRAGADESNLLRGRHSMCMNYVTGGIMSEE